MCIYIAIYPCCGREREREKGRRGKRGIKHKSEVAFEITIIEK